MKKKLWYKNSAYRVCYRVLQIQALDTTKHHEKTFQANPKCVVKRGFTVQSMHNINLNNFH